jgi:acyl-coenzyme A synthetase/AMP-(fatty) acid ligase
MNTDRFNFTVDVVDAWAKRDKHKLALVAVAADGHTTTHLSFGEVSETAARAASVLRAAGVQQGDRVFVQLPRIPEWYAVMLGCIKLGAVVMPGTTQLVKDDVSFRMREAECSIAVTDAEHCSLFDDNVSLRVVASGAAPIGWISLSDSMALAEPLVDAAPTRPDDPMLLYFTSGTTGYPKMVLHTQASAGLGHALTAKRWFMATETDLHWTVSDFGWAKAAWGKLFGPWSVGTAIFLWDIRGKPDYQRMIELIGEHRVTTFCAPPTVYRSFVQLPLARCDWSHLRHCTAAGEPLNPEVIRAWKEATGLGIYDGYGQTETICVVCNRPGLDVRPGSMGKPMPGFNVDIVDDEGRVLPDNEEGHIAIETDPRPLGLFKEYWHAPELNAQVFRNGWYYTGDRAYRDPDGYLWFVGRADDVILSSGYRIGPFEVESALLSHPGVVEAGVVGQPDEQRGEIVCGFVMLAPGYSPSDMLVRELQEHCKRVTAPYKYPRRILFVDALPKTISGKIRRIDLRRSLTASKE